MVTGRDLEILRHAERYGITISQCSKLFFSDAKFGDDLARKRLKKLHEQGMLKQTKNWDCNKSIYYTRKLPSMHDILLMDAYAEFIVNGAEIVEFKKEATFGNLRSDGFIHYKKGNIDAVAFIEVVLTNKVDFKKYETLKESNIVQQQYKVFPMLIVIDENPKKYSGKNLRIYNVSHKMDGLKAVL